MALPTVTSSPDSPNNDVTTFPMEWVTEDADSASTIDLLTINGIEVIVAGVLQPGFTGTIVANASNGYDISFTADVDYWAAHYNVTWEMSLTDIDGTNVESGTIDKLVTLPFAVPEEVIDPLLFEAPSFPFRFTSKADLALAKDELSVEDSMRSAIMVRKLGIPLRPFIGSNVADLVFDPKDVATRELVAAEAIDAVRAVENRVILDDNPLFIEDVESNSISLTLFYRYRNTNSDWRSFRLAEPEFRSIDKVGT